MRKKGGINYKIPHMHKKRQQKEGRLPIALSLDVDLVEQTLALIAAADLEEAAAEKAKEELRKRKKSSRTIQPEKGEKEQRKRKKRSSTAEAEKGEEEHGKGKKRSSTIKADKGEEENRKRKKRSTVQVEKGEKEHQQSSRAIPLVTCVPAKVVFSRIMEAVGRPCQVSNRPHMRKIRRQEEEKLPINVV
ncbi:unnamed protein product [Alopecurus aequalis]